jgi:hypothetical protein
MLHLFVRQHLPAEAMEISDWAEPEEGDMADISNKGNIQRPISGG